MTYERMAAQPDQAGNSPAAAKRSPALALVWAVMGATLVTAALTGVAIAAASRPHWWAGWSAALVVSLIAALVSLGRVIVSLRGDPQLVVYGYLAGALLRGLVTLGGGVIAVMVFRTPAVPTLLVIIPLYFAQLVAEVIVLGRAFIRVGGGGGEARQ